MKPALFLSRRVYKDENDRFELPCVAHADPDPDITWYKYDIRVQSNYRRHIREDGALDIMVSALRRPWVQFVPGESSGLKPPSN